MYRKVSGEVQGVYPVPNPYTAPHSLLRDTGVAGPVGSFAGTRRGSCTTHWSATARQNSGNLWQGHRRSCGRPIAWRESTNLIRGQKQCRILALVAGTVASCRKETTAILEHAHLFRLGAAYVSLLVQNPDTYTFTADRNLLAALCDLGRTVIYFCAEPGQPYTVAYSE